MIGSYRRVLAVGQLGTNFKEVLNGLFLAAFCQSAFVDMDEGTTFDVQLTWPPILD